MHLEMHEGGWVWYPAVHNYAHASHTHGVVAKINF